MKKYVAGVAGVFDEAAFQWREKIRAAGIARPSRHAKQI